MIKKIKDKYFDITYCLFEKMIALCFQGVKRYGTIGMLTLTLVVLITILIILKVV